MIRQIAPLRGVQRAYILLSLVFLWPAIVNGGAFYFPDTTAYIRGPDAMFHHAVGWRSAWTQHAVLIGDLSPTTKTFEHAPEHPSGNGVASPRDAKPVLLGRSVFYGILPFIGVVIGSDWWTILVQALIAGAVLVGFVRHFVDPERRAFGWTCVVTFALLTVTPLPFFTSMLMPDFMAGAGIVAATALMMGWKRESWSGRAFWFVIVTVAALMHSANILILLALTAPPFLLAITWRDGAALRGVAFVAAGAMLGLIGEAVFVRAVTQITGTAPIRPPFIAARLIEDGPGLAYLDRTCPGSDFLLCRYRQRMPAGSDTFLWSADPEHGVFKAVSPATQRALSNEQSRFIAAVATTFPIDVAHAAVLAAGRQVALLSLIEFNYSREERFNQVPSSVMQTIMATRAYARTMPVKVSEALLWPLVFLSLWIIAIASAFPRTRPSAVYAAMIVVGWLANDIVCGMLSTPHDRYQARIIWILPLAAALIIAKSALDESFNSPSSFLARFRSDEGNIGGIDRSSNA